MPSYSSNQTRKILRAPDSSCDSAYQQFYTDPDASHFYGGRLRHKLLGLVWLLIWKLAAAGFIGRNQSDRELSVRGGAVPRELTWWIDPQSRGKGYALEASQAAIAHAYDVFGLRLRPMNDVNLAARGLVENQNVRSIDEVFQMAWSATIFIYSP